MSKQDKMLLSGNEAVAHAALDCGVALGVGYPGTPSTEILENFSLLGGKAQWSPNEKAALEVGIGSAFANARTLVTMKHVGVNVAADPLFTAAYTGVEGGLVLITADDPGMASSQNEQDNRHYARAAGVPMLEPSDSQDAYDLFIEAMELSEQMKTIVFLRMTTRICHSKTIVERREVERPDAAAVFKRDVQGKVMIPAFARPAHKKLRQKLASITEMTESSDTFLEEIEAGSDLGIVTSGVSYAHVREAAPEASVLKLEMTYPLPIERIRAFSQKVKRCIVIEEGDHVLRDDLRAAGICVDAKPEMYRFGELNVERVTRILNNDVSEEAAPPKGKPPQLCPGCPHRTVFEVLRDRGCTVSGDIGCYTLGVLPPFQAIDTCVCMGASITVGLGMRHVLPAAEAKKVVSVIGDSTFMHTGLSGITDMVYNTPPTGHVVLILDNSTTAMTGLQEHPGTGRSLDHQSAHKVVFEDVVKAMGVQRVHVVDNPTKDPQAFDALVGECLDSEETCVIIARRPCILAIKKIAQYEQANNGGEEN